MAYDRETWLRGLNPGDEAWTDYPFKELGEAAGVEASWKPVTFLRHDGNKYCDVRLPNNVMSSLKTGYLHRSRENGRAWWGVLDDLSIS